MVFLNFCEASSRIFLTPGETSSAASRFRSSLPLCRAAAGDNRSPSTASFPSGLADDSAFEDPKLSAWLAKALDHAFRV